MGFFKAKTTGCWGHFRAYSNQPGDAAIRLLHLIKEWLTIYTWSEMHICILASGILFYAGGLLWLTIKLQALYPPLGVILFYSVFISLAAGAAMVDYARKKQS